ncbi:hypothetical protein AFLA_010405 [Aspergillus flavus NRRL3357]|nr:hypothetical protein AFLA_010405 [Aspergillus flavus NRRL3357]
MSAIYTEVADWKTEPRIFTEYLSYASANDKPRVKAGHCGGNADSCGLCQISVPTQYLHGMNAPCKQAYRLAGSDEVVRKYLSIGPSLLVACPYRPKVTTGRLGVQIVNSPHPTRAKSAYLYFIFGDLIERPSGADPDVAHTYDTDCFKIIFDQADIEVHALLHVADEFIQHSAVGSEVWILKQLGLGS